MYKIIKPALILLSFYLMSSCSSVKIQRSDKIAKDTKLDRVLIIAMTKNYDTRAMYEKELSFRLRQKGYNMFSSVNIDKSRKGQYSKEEILKLIDEKNINGVITMKLVDITTKEKYTTSDRYISDLYNQHNYFYNYIDTYYNVYSWQYQPDKRVTVEADLFDAADKSMIFRAEATSKNTDSQEERAGYLTNQFTKALAKSGLLKKKSN